MGSRSSSREVRLGEGGVSCAEALMCGSEVRAGVPRGSSSVDEVVCFEGYKEV